MPPSFAARLAGFAARHTLDDARTAAALGVPIYTARKWTTGTRAPSAAAVRLLDVLETLEAIAPAIFSAFLPPVSTTPPRKRGRVKNLAGEIGHVEKSGSTGSTDSLDNSVMSKNPV
jgi:hypothetical protein